MLGFWGILAMIASIVAFATFCAVVMALIKIDWLQPPNSDKKDAKKIYVQILEEHIAESGDGFILFSCKVTQYGATTLTSYVISGNYTVYSHPNVKEVCGDEKLAVELAHRTWLHIKARNLEITKIKKKFSADSYRRSA